MLKFSLKKQEILRSKKLIEELFNKGKSVYRYPIKFKYLVSQDREASESPVLFSVTVPKKIIKSAAKRNLLKRRIREAYRLNKRLLVSDVPSGVQISFMIIYTSRDIESYHKIERSLKKILSSNHIRQNLN